MTGILAGAAESTSSYAITQDREAELLFRGLAIRDAIRRFYQAGFPTKTYPRSLSDLVRDPRYPRKRHLRALYADPLPGTTEWALVRTPDGGIAGVASQSKAVPVKQANFSSGLESFEGAKSYSDWVFLYQPGFTK